MSTSPEAAQFSHLSIEERGRLADGCVQAFTDSARAYPVGDGAQAIAFELGCRLGRYPFNSYIEMYAFLMCFPRVIARITKKANDVHHLVNRGKALQGKKPLQVKERLKVKEVKETIDQKKRVVEEALALFLQEGNTDIVAALQGLLNVHKNYQYTQEEQMRMALEGDRPGDKIRLFGDKVLETLERRKRALETGVPVRSEIDPDSHFHR